MISGILENWKTGIMGCKIGIRPFVDKNEFCSDSYRPSFPTFHHSIIPM
jgi:hypothetical protein